MEVIKSLMTQTIVSLTPIRLEEDSRTLKIAESFRRIGFTSKVVEIGKSKIKSNSIQTISILQDIKSNSDKSKQNDRKKLPTNIPLQKRDDNTQITYTLTLSFSGLGEKLSNFLSEKFNINLDFRHYLRYFLIFVRDFYHLYFIKHFSHIPRASLYYLHAPYQFPSVYLKSLIYRVPYIYDAHDFYTSIENKEERNYFNRKFCDPFYEWNEKQCIKHAALVVTVSDGVASMIEKKFNRKPLVIRNTQDLRVEQPLPYTLRQELGLSKNDFVVVIVGAGKKGQAILELLEVIKNLHNRIKVVFLGKNHEDTTIMIKIMRLEKYVFVHDPVKPNEVISFIHDADVAMVIYYSRSVNYKYCLPNGFFQSISAGLPLIYPNLPEMKKVIRKKEVGIMINPRNKKHIKNALNQMLDDKIRARYKKNVMEMKKTLTWEREEKILLDVLKNKLKLI